MHQSVCGSLAPPDQLEELSSPQDPLATAIREGRGRKKGGKNGRLEEMGWKTRRNAEYKGDLPSPTKRV